MNESPLYVMVSYHVSLRGALPIHNIVRRLGGLLKQSSIGRDAHTHVFFFDRKIYGRTFIKVIERADMGFVTTALNSTN